MVTRTLVTVGLLSATGLLAAGGGAKTGAGGVGGVPTPGIAEVAIGNEVIPAGGTVQVKYRLTTPRPIFGGGPKLLSYDFNLNGIGVNSPLGDTYGVGLCKDGTLAVEIVSPSGDYGTADYPFLTVAMTLPLTAKSGAVYPLVFPETVYQSPAGPVTLQNLRPGNLTVGGSLSIHGMVPGGGTWPAGTAIRLQGTGFLPKTVVTSKMRTTNALYVSPTEMVFYLSTATTLDSIPVTATNPDKSSVTYYSYLRGVPVSQPTKLMLQKADPIFQTLTNTAATVTMPVLAATQFLALAVQNPLSYPVSVSFNNQRTGQTVFVSLPFAGRLMDDIAGIFNAPPQAGDVITINATAGVQMLGLTGDEAVYTLKPWLPQF